MIGSDLLIRFKSEEEGVVAAITALVFFVLLCFGAFTIDAGRSLSIQRHLQYASDAADRKSVV